MSTANFSTPAYLPDFPAIGSTSGLGPHRAEDYWKLPEGEPVELIWGHYLFAPTPCFHHQATSLLMTEAKLACSAMLSGALGRPGSLFTCAPPRP